MLTSETESRVNSDEELKYRIKSRLEKYTRLSGECLVWIGNALTHGGYGKLNINGVVLRAHRLAWIISHGQIPVGLCVCHHCDNPKCLNTDHLFLGSKKDNTQDMISKNRHSRPPTFYGENHANCKVTDSMIDQILSSSGSLVSIAKKFGVCDLTVSRIRNGTRRKTNASL